jgi:DNA-binding transcriptional ArsR family regulator
MLNFSTDLDSAFLALADASRRGIIERLAHGPASVSDLAKPLPMSLPAVMQHIAVLEGVGLIRSEKIGRTRTCRLEPDRLAQIEAWITDQRQAWNARLDRLALYLETQQPEETSRGNTSAD